MTGFRRIGRRFYVKQALRHLRWRTLREKERWPLAISRLRDTQCHTVEDTEKNEHSCRLWDTHSREHTLSHSWRHTESHNWRHRKKTWTQLQILRHTQQGTHSVTQSKVYCVTQLKSHRHTMLQKPRNRDIALQTLRNTKLTPPPPSTLEWHPHNSPCAHPPPHFELHFSGNVNFLTFTAMPLFEAIYILHFGICETLSVSYSTNCWVTLNELNIHDKSYIPDDCIAKAGPINLKVSDFEFNLCCTRAKTLKRTRGFETWQSCDNWGAYGNGSSATSYNWDTWDNVRAGAESGRL